MSDPDIAASPEASRFASLDALRGAHQDRMDRLAGSDGAAPEARPEEIAAFLAKAQATGAVIDAPADRRAAQRILDYWAAELVSASRGSAEGGRPLLAPHAAPVATSEVDAPRAAFQHPEDARQYIRVSALARQWRDSAARGDGSARGYLLSGDALRDAERFARDPDVAALIAASRTAQDDMRRQSLRRKNVLIAVMAAAIVALAALAWFSVTQQRAAEDARGIAERERGLAQEAAEEAAEEAADALAALRDSRASEEAARAALAESQMLRARLEDVNATITRRLASEQTRQRALNEAVDIIASQIGEDDLDFDSIGDSGLRDLLRPRLSVATDAGPSYTRPRDDGDDDDDDGDVEDTAATTGAEPGDTGKPSPAPEGPAYDLAGLDGYRAGFLGLDLPLPSPGGTQARTAWQGGQPIPYHNFSIVLDTQQRLPILAATNLDRVTSRTLPDTPAPLPAPDPRIPADQQPGGTVAEGFTSGPLVARADIAWGQDLPADPLAAAAFIARMTSFNPTLAPMAPSFERGPWREVEDWIRLQHNPGASRVTIFAGPVLSRDAATPVAYWRVAVSAQPGLYKDPAGAPLAVDAFLVPNEPASASRDQADRGVERFRVRINQLVVLTGLTFPSAIADADSNQGLTLASRIGDLASPSDAVRGAFVQRAATLLTSPTAAAAERRALCTALLDLAESDAMGALPPEGQEAVFFLLSQVPASAWAGEAWAPLTGRARWLVAEVTAELGSQTSLDAWRERLGLGAPPGQTVYFQFAGLTRDSARTIADRLRSLGWQVPDTERVSAEVNQVRYNPATPGDEAAARMLAADLDAAGHAGVVPAAFDIVRPGVLEVWISR